MNRFNTDEDKPQTLKDIATDIIFSDLYNNQKVELIVSELSKSYLNGQRELLTHIAENYPKLTGNLSEYLMQLRIEAPIYND